MGFLSDIMGTESEATAVSTLSPWQQKMEKEIYQTLKGKTGQPATAYEGQLTAEVPSLFTSAYNALAGRTGSYYDTIASSLLRDVNAQPAFSFDPASITQEWKEQFAIPAMETYRQVVDPIVREGFNVTPGGFYSSAAGRGIGRAATDYYGSYVQPTLFQALQTARGQAFESGENAAARSQTATSALTNLPAQTFAGAAGAADIARGYEQERLDALRSEFLRTTPEASPWLQASLAYLGVPTTEAVAIQGQQGIASDLLSLAGSMSLGKAFGVI